MVNHSSVLAWEIPWTEEPGGWQYMGLQKVEHDLVTTQQQQWFQKGILIFRKRAKSSTYHNIEWI